MHSVATRAACSFATVGGVFALYITGTEYTIDGGTVRTV